MTGKKAAIALALTLFMVLAGTGVGNAFWNAQATTTSGVSAGAIGISQSGFQSLQMTYNATALVAAAPVTVTNTGTITAPYTLTLAAQSASSLASGAQVRTWVVTTVGECTASVTVPGGATDTNWTNVPAMTGTLAPSAKKIYCVRTSITAPQQTSLASTSMVGTLSLVSALGLWNASVTAVTPAHTVTDTAAPTVPAAPIASATTSTQTTLTWAASTDNVGVTDYAVYRDSVFFTTVTSPTFTNTGLTAATTYSYAIKARDAAGNVSAASGLTAVTTAAAGDTTPPSTPSKPVVSDTTVTQTTLTWAASTDNVGVAGYVVYRGGAPIATVTSTSFTDTGLTAGTAYTYAIVAKDAAGNVSAPSAAASVTTLVVSPTGWFKVSNGGNCVEVENASTANGTNLTIPVCTGASNQNWQFTPTGDGTYRATPRYAPAHALAWEISGNNNPQLGTYGGLANQKWDIITLANGSYQFSNRGTGKCLSASGASATLQNKACSAVDVSQSFSVTEVP